MNIIIAGGTGFVGKFISEKLLEDGHHIIIVSRAKKNINIESVSNYKTINWAEYEKGLDCKIDVIINLSGESIGGGLWNSKKKELILKSRINATSRIVESISNRIYTPSILISSSAIGYYGNRGDENLNEQSESGNGFLADVCKAWELEASKAEKFGVKVVYLRTGFVLGKNEATQKLLLPHKFYAGGTLGSGIQWVSWIHINDLANIISFIIENKIEGAVNAVSPNPVTMKTLQNEIGKALNRPSWLKVPTFLLRLVMGKMADIILNSQKVVPQKLTNHGYQYQYPTINIALKSLLRKP